MPFKTMHSINPSVLVASDNASDANLVKRLLAKDFSRISTSTVEEKAAADFEQHLPDILVLAFKALERAERFYLGLYRHCARLSVQPHRTIILCGKNDVHRVSKLCLQQHFDDYVLFWPMNYDAPRLSMAIHLAYRELSKFKDEGPSLAEFAGQARRLGELESLLEQYMAAGSKQVNVTQQAVEHAEREINAVVDGWSRQLSRAANTHAVPVDTVETMERELARFKEEDIAARFNSVRDSVRPIGQWTKSLTIQCAAPLESVRSLSAMAEKVKPAVLVVDDDDFQHKIVATILGNQSYRLVFATSGAEALSSVRKERPDLILMDVMMPDMDGLETLTRIRLMPQLARVPVMMISAKSEGALVVQCLKSGAADFAVKPFDRDTLYSKVSRLSMGVEAKALRAHAN
jgi:CheY-like chemotaxis protein